MSRNGARAMLAATLACVALAALNFNVAAQQPDSISSNVRALQQVNGEAIYTGEIPPDVRALLTRLKWQIGVATVSDKDAARLPAKLYFTVARERGDFRMRGVSDARPPGCSGETQIPKSGAR